MWLARGDLVRIPANSCLTQRVNELSIIDKYTYLEKPTLGIFIKYTPEYQALVFINNNYWMIDLPNVKYAGVKNVS